MKLLMTITILFFAVVSTSHAGWNSSTIKFIQGSATSNNIFVYLDAPVPFDNCQTVNELGQFMLRQDTGTPENNFDQLYAQLMLANAADKPIWILSSSGDCYNENFIDGPYIRFE